VTELEATHASTVLAIAEAERYAAMQAERARSMLDAADYSGAATACHRAHQHTLVAGALRGVLGR
jgi:hypothetical protein